MGCCKPNKKCKLKKTNKCKKPPVSTTKHHKSCKCLPEEKHCIVNDNFYDNYYEKCNHYYITDCNHITDHYHEYNIYHYDTKTTHEKEYTCEDIEKKEPKNHCVEKKNDCAENENYDYCHGYDSDYYKKYREDSDF
jgi:alpha-galactosidase/6-phospho-beta-glucosidase family protein